MGRLRMFDLNQATDTAQLLGDSGARNYARKLQLFNEFAAPELRQAIATLQLEHGMRVLDAGCGTGVALAWFAEAVGDAGFVVGFDLAKMHAIAARAHAPAAAVVLQADLLKPPIAQSSVDLIWCANTINHLRNPLAALNHLTSLLRPSGRIALVQSSFLPDMYFAWDARLEKATHEAVYRYYQDRYGVSERELTDIRALIGLARQAGMSSVTAKTFVIERTFPVDAATEAYLREALFLGTWRRDRLRPYMSTDDQSQLDRACDPNSPEYALRRQDFHFLQTLTMVTGRGPDQEAHT